MFLKRIIRVVAIGVTLVVAAVLNYQVFVPMRPLRPHRGDGAFRDLSRRVNGWPYYGYGIRFRHFDLGEEYHAEFRLTGLPEIGRRCGVCLAIEDPDDRWREKSEKDLRGSVRLELVDRRGQPLAQAGGSLLDFNWTTLPVGKGMYARVLYQDGSFFKPVAGEEYCVRIAYAPEARLASLRGYAYLECRQSK